MKIKYNFLKKKELGKVKSFLQKYYHERFNKLSIKWEFEENPFGDAKVIVAIYNNKIIGCGVAIPLKFRIIRKKEVVYRVQNVLVDNKFRKKGIFQNILIKFDNYFINKKIKLISFPNALSLKGFINNKWQKLLNINFLSKKIQKTSKLDKYYKYRKIFKFENKHYIFYQQKINLNHTNLECSEEYLNWRFIFNKRSKFDCYEIVHKKTIKAILVLKKYKFEKERNGQICLFISDKKDLSKIINFCNNYCYKNNLTILTLWSNQYEKVFINKFGFKNRLYKEKFMIFKNFDKDIAKKINLAMHYSDVF